jgi:hypothetical protein
VKKTNQEAERERERERWMREKGRRAGGGRKKMTSADESEGGTCFEYPAERGILDIN